ncbi:hypothetical protein D049_0029B, partial [Vibrio parahaemolyticus VPTS-2010]
NTDHVAMQFQQHIDSGFDTLQRQTLLLIQL